MMSEPPPLGAPTTHHLSGIPPQRQSATLDVPTLQASHSNDQHHLLVNGNNTPNGPNHCSSMPADPDDEASIGDPQQDLQILLEPATERPIGRPNRGAFRHLKKPPQPHMCIKDQNAAGEDLYINVMSWTRIMMPASADHPIPLYGGMRVPPGSARSPQNVYAVMVNPEILKHVGRNCDDPEEKCALVELMSDFVEAMNPGLGLARNPEILKDRDLAGELKDIWGAVQAKRERDKDGQSAASTPLYGAPSYYRYSNEQSGMTYVEFGPEANGKPEDGPQQPPTVSAVPIATPVTSVQQPQPSAKAEITPNGKLAANGPSKLPIATRSVSSPVAASDVPDGMVNPSPDVVSDKPSDQADSNKNAVDKTTSKSPAVSATSSPPTSTKKEKLGGFLPNGCHNIFPFIKSKNGSSKKDKKAKDGSTKSATNSPIKVNGDNSSSKKTDVSSNETAVTDNVEIKDDTIVVDKLQKMKL